MKKAISLFLALVMCLSLCACGGDTQESQNGSENTENKEDIQNQVDAEFIAMVCGRWELYSGWRELGGVLEFREDGVCIINGEALKWDAAFANKQWLDAPKEFINVYRNNELVYEAHIDIRNDGTIALIISERDDVGLGIVPAGAYMKPGDNEEPMAKEKIDLICGITWWYELGNPEHDFGRRFYEDGGCVPAAGGNLTGTWTLDGDVISITSAKPNSNQVFEYRLKTYNGVHFLIGEHDTWVSVKNNEIPSKIPTKKVSISLDNWQEYFEYITFSQRSKKIDIWGTATEETATYGVLKLKDEYSSRLVKIVSEADAKFTIAGAEDRMENLVAGRLYSIIDYPEPGGTYGEFQGQELYFIGEAMELDEEQVNSASFEMTDIQGTLYFIDIE